MRIPFMCKFPVQPYAFFRRQPGRHFGTVGEIRQHNPAEQHRGQPFNQE